jgi:hypothetical protein
VERFQFILDTENKKNPYRLNTDSLLLLRMTRKNIVDRRFFLKLNAATAIGLTLRADRVFAQAAAVTPEMAALSS